MFNFAKTMSAIGLILCVQIFLPTEAFAQMEEVRVIGYKIVITRPDGLFRFDTSWTVDMSNIMPTTAQQAPPDDQRREGFNLCAEFDNPDGSISFFEELTIDAAVASCLAAVIAANPPTFGMANFGALGCLSLWGVLADQMCSD